MKRLAALVLLLATPAFAASGEVTVLRGTPAPPTPWYEPPPPPPQPVVVYQPLIYQPGLYAQPFYAAPLRQHRIPDGWPLFRR
jgi:hypothetical protein